MLHAPVCASLFLYVGFCAAASAQKNRTTLKVTANDVRVGAAQLKQVPWDRDLLADMTSEGQFEVLVRKSSQPTVIAEACKRPWLLLRMSAVSADDPRPAEALARRKQMFDALQRLGTNHEPFTFPVTAFSYGKAMPSGKLRLSGCNLWFTTK